jgi:hypothetical protein
LIQIIGPPEIYIHGDEWLEEKFPKFLGDIPKRIAAAAAGVSGVRPPSYLRKRS